MAMDKKLIDSISNFASALEQLVEELKAQDQEKEKNRNMFAGIFGSKGITRTMKRVEEGIKDIKKDTTEIIKNQKKLIGLNKLKRREENRNVVGESGEKDQMDKIKSGVGSIILIAAAVLAIGMAFKIISPVDVISVLALSFAITLLGFTLARLKKVGVPSAKESFLIGLSLLAFTTAVVATSWLLNLISDVSMAQLGVFGAILGTFSLLSFGMKTLMESTKDMKPKQLLHLPLILVGISMAIVASSWILSMAHYIQPSDLLNILLLGGTLGMVALIMTAPIYALNKMGKGVIKSIFLSMTVLPAIAFGIVSSSWILALANYIPPAKLANILLMGLTMSLVALVMTVPLYALNKMGKGVIKSAFLAMVVLPALAVGIMLSSLILNKVVTIPPRKLLNVLLIGMTLGLISLIMTIPLSILNKKGRSVIGSAFLAVIILPALALGILLSSHLLNKVITVPPKKLLNAILIGATMALVSTLMLIPILVMGKYAGKMIKGALVAVVALPLISLGLALSSIALSLGNYSKPLPLDYVLSFSLAMLLLVIPVYILGKMNPFSIAFGAIGLVMVSWAIAKSSRILAGANPKGFEKIADAIAYFMKVTGPYIKEFMTYTIPLIAKGIGLLVTSVLPPLKVFIGAVLPMIQNFITGIINGLTPMVKVLSGVITGIIDSVGGLFESIGIMVEKVSSGLPAITGAFKVLGDAISKPLGKVNDIINSFGNAIVNVITSVVDAVTTFSQMDPNKLTTVGTSLGVIGDAISDLTGGFTDTALRFFTGGKEDPITRILKSITENGTGVVKVGKSFESLVNGVDKLNNIEIDKSNVNGVLNVLERINEMKNVSGNIEAVSKQLVEVEGLTNITEPKNEKILKELRDMNSYLNSIAGTNVSISGHLREIRNNSDSDGSGLGFNNNK